MKTKRIYLLICLIFICGLLIACNETSSLSFDKDLYIIEVDEEFSPTVRIRPKGNDYTLTVSNDTIASVEGKEITGIRTGKVTITATSGNYTASADLIVSDFTSNNTDISIDGEIRGSCYVYGHLVNYELADLKTDLFSIDPVLTNSIYLTNPPVISGYTSYGWFWDKDLTMPFDPYESEITEDIDLYFSISANENSFKMNGDGHITGIVYSNLPHAELVFPSEIKGVEVTGIEDGAFKEDTKLTSVTIPASYTYIGKSAFAGCVNLTTFNIPDDSQLKEIGDFAFSITTRQEQVGVPGDDEDPVYETVLNDNACEKLQALNLPDTVEKIGNSAFCYCYSLVIDGIPSALTEVEYAVFCGTKINNIDFSNIQIIRSYGFRECSELTKVSNTQNVELCEADAFLDCRMFLEQENKDIIYVGTIVVGCTREFGVLGGGKIHLKEDTTLISRGAVNAAQQNEITVFFNTLDDDRLVYVESDAFLNVNGVCLVVPERLIDRYKKTFYTYEDRFCSEYVINVTDTKVVTNSEGKQQTIADVNFGMHTLLKFSELKYYYESFTVCESMPGFKSSPTEIRFSLLDPTIADYIQRINTGAINLGLYGGKLTYLETYKVKEFAPLAITNCFPLATIDMRNIQYVPEMNSNSFQFTSIGKDGYINSTQIGNPEPEISEYKLVGLNENLNTGLKLYKNKLKENEYVYRNFNVSGTKSLKLTFGDEIYYKLNERSTAKYTYGNESIILEAGTYDIYFNSETKEIRLTPATKPECKILVSDAMYYKVADSWETEHKTAFAHLVRESDLIS